MLKSRIYFLCLKLDEVADQHKMKPLDALCGVKMEVLTGISLDNVSPNHSIMATLYRNAFQLPCNIQLFLLPSLWGKNM